ncbi:MAG TPA: ATP-binding protein [Solirubrobacteraceae bacterium]|jgi:two-component system sensor histidine kinase KdpD|nr:ATP-binding protein [Solirubrobacteraceae bacterium]
MFERAGLPLLVGSRRPSRAAGVFAVLSGLALATLAIYPLRHAAPVESLGVVYLPLVVLVSMFWGMRFGVASAVLSAAAFSFFHLPPVGRLALADGRDWTGLAALTVAAITTGLIADLARSHAHEADQRRREADLAADLARILLGAARLQDALPVAAERVAVALGVARATIALDQEPSAAEAAIPLCGEEAGVIGSLHLQDGVPPRELEWARHRLAPQLSSILAAALYREQLSAEVVETAALRRSDEMKTALLRSVSHDLRTPVTAILGAAAALDATAPEPAQVREVRELVTDAATRLSLLIEKLLDLSVLQAGSPARHAGPCSLDEVLHEAIAHTGSAEVFRLSIDPDLPLIHGDAAQLERALANVLENAARYSAGEPVSVRARAVGGRVRVRIVDRGPGVPSSEYERVFLPFYRGPGAPSDHHGSGLGLAIAKGFVEVNGGRIAVESTPGQGTSFVIELPFGEELPALAAAGRGEAP